MIFCTVQHTLALLRCLASVPSLQYSKLFIFRGIKTKHTCICNYSHLRKLLNHRALKFCFLTGFIVHNSLQLKLLNVKPKPRFCMFINMLLFFCIMSFLILCNYDVLLQVNLLVTHVDMTDLYSVLFHNAHTHTGIFYSGYNQTLEQPPARN